MKNLHITPPEPPTGPNVIEVPAFSLTLDSPLLGRLPKAAMTSEDVKSMEDLDQSYGFVLYRKRFENGLKGALTLPVVRDYAWVMIDGRVVGEGMTQPSGRNGPKGTETVTTAVSDGGEGGRASWRFWCTILGGRVHRSIRPIHGKG